MNPHVNPRNASLLGMAKTKPDPERVEWIERFESLLYYVETRMGLNQTALSRVLGVKKSTITNAKARGVSADLKLALQRGIGLQQRYWESPKRLEPAECILKKSHGGDLDRIVAIAKSRGEPTIVLGELAALDVPHDADAWWWMEQYFRITDAHRPPHRKAS